MEGKIATEYWMEEGIMTSAVVGRIDGLHACIETDDEEIEIHA